jgi:hypothetical protein
MAKEDYSIDGVNISKIYKEQKIGWGNNTFHKLTLKYDIEVISDNNNLIQFKLGDKIYYFGVASSKIREKGSNEWTTKIMTKLKSDFNNKIPLR